ncbi:MAG: prepilin-type N-terminal cleavage/methylation domain-containing protein [Candidatus Omnitrophica bacterium]|nr:prepilin-type N-terminal cleavage/methylation domain-containing protein [Candidatus Omnitrophota bacterium]
MNSLKSASRGFTLTEVLVVIILIGMIIAFGIPSFVKTINRTDEKQAISHLKMIWEALQLHRAKSGTYQVGDLGDLNAINNALGLYLVPAKITFQCSSVGVDQETCRANGTGWSLIMDTQNVALGSGAIYCLAAGTCPTCQANGNGCN